MRGHRSLHPRRGIALYVAGDLPERRAARLARHLAGCPDCRELARRLAEDRLALGRLAGQPVEERSLRRVRAGVAARIGGLETARERRSPGAARRLAALAAVLLLAALGLMIWSPPRTPSRPGGQAAGPPLDRIASTAPSPPVPETAGPVAAQPPPSAGHPAPEARRPAPAPAPAPRPGTAVTPAPSGAHRRPRRRAAAAPPASRPSEPLVIQVVSDHPDIVYYWLAEPEETHRESTSR